MDYDDRCRSKVMLDHPTRISIAFVLHIAVPSLKPPRTKADLGLPVATIIAKP
jgi:hypothetical protein